MYDTYRKAFERLNKTIIQHILTANEEAFLPKKTYLSFRNMSQKAQLLAWAQAKTLLGYHQVEIEYETTETPRDILKRYNPQNVDLEFCKIAVDQTIHPWDQSVGKITELALIPPVSGG